MSRPVIFGVPLTPSKLYDVELSNIEGKNMLGPFRFQTPIKTGVSQSMYQSNRIEDADLSLEQKTALMYKNAIIRRNERADIEMLVGAQMKLKRKNGLASGYGVSIK
jgi:hypothetical protein